MAVVPETMRDDMTWQMGLVWEQVKSPVIVPALRLAVFLCLVMSVMLLVEKVYMAVVIVLFKLLGKRPDKRYKWEPIKDDVELGNSAYPMVLVQIPMYNEKEVPITFFFFLFVILYYQFIMLHGLFYQVYQLSIGAACGLSWPSDRIIIQVLDDSTDPVIKVIFCASHLRKTISK